MAILKTSALCTLALAAVALPQQADAHAFLLKPQVDINSRFKNLWANEIPGKSVPPDRYFLSPAERSALPSFKRFEDGGDFTLPWEQVCADRFTANYKAGNWKSLKEFVLKLQVPSGQYQDRPAGGTPECGFTNPNARPQPLPDMVEFGNYNFQRLGVHPGPCEAWCDDEIVIPLQDDCRKILFKPIPYAKEKCVGKSRFTFYWVATHFPPFQVYTNCAPLQGATPGARGNATSMASAAPMAKKPMTPNGKVAMPNTKPSTQVASDANTIVKCKAKTN